jgi:hypothetical protein
VLLKHCRWGSLGTWHGAAPATLEAIAIPDSRGGGAPRDPHRHPRYRSALVLVEAGVDVVAVVGQGEGWAYAVQVEAVDELGGVEGVGELG